MMSEGGIAQLVGFIRQVPDVRTFVALVFEDSAGTKLTQRWNSALSDQITELVPTVADRKFDAIVSRLCARTGGAVLHGFEFSEDVVVVGSGHALASFLDLQLQWTYDYAAELPRTTAAIRRFIEKYREVPAPRIGTLFELTKDEASQVYELTSLLHPAAGRGEIAVGREALVDCVLRSIAGDHLGDLGVHWSRQRWRRRAIADHQYPDFSFEVTHAMAEVAQSLRIQNNRLACRGRLICSQCTYQLIADYASPVSILCLTKALASVDLTQVSLWSQSELVGGLRTVHSYLRRQGKRMVHDGAFFQFSDLIERLGRDPTLAPLGAGLQLSEWKLFVDTSSRAVQETTILTDISVSKQFDVITSMVATQADARAKEGTNEVAE